jgi:ABC-type uncharacterized transport system involved in gliding motility auxiliary subunit
MQPDKESFLEYDVAKLINELSVAKKPAVGLISGLPMSASFDPQTRQMREAWAVDTQLQQSFEVRQLSAPSLKTIDKDIGVLVLIHPKNLPDDAQYAIDQFVLRGGHLLVFVDPQAEADDSGADPNNPQAAMFANKSSDLPKLFKAWGVQYDPNKVVIDRTRALQISMSQGAPPVRDAAILGLGKRDLNPNDVTTANLDTINISSPGFFQLDKDSKNKLVPLIQSSTDSMTVPSERVKFLLDVSALLTGFQPSGESYVVAGRLEGKFATAFPDRKDEGHLSAAKDDGVVVLVADTDMLSNRLWVQIQPFFGQKLMNAFANNGDFFVNSVDNLTGSSDLISTARPDVAASVHHGRGHAPRRRGKLPRQEKNTASSATPRKPRRTGPANRDQEMILRRSSEPNCSASSTRRWKFARNCVRCVAASTTRSNHSARASNSSTSA